MKSAVENNLMRTRNNSSEASDEVLDAWRRIKEWISTHVPAWANGPDPLFQQPATSAAIAQLETYLRVRVPDELKTLLLTNDGCRRGDYPLPMNATKPVNWRTISVNEIAEQWDLLSSIDAGRKSDHAMRTVGPVSAVWWNRNWIPIAECGTGDVICADMNPEQGGSRGQLIYYEHDFDERKVLYPSLLDWLRECANDLERGEYTYVAGVGLQSVKG
jgi:cell wall assembly regulator SMI1